MPRRRFISPKEDVGCILEIDRELYHRLPQIIQPYLGRTFSNESVEKVEPTSGHSWIVGTEEWTLVIEAGPVPRSGRFECFIHAHPEAAQEVRALASLLIDYGASCIKAVEVDLK